MTMKPYPYQQPCLNALRRVRANGGSRSLVVMATGLGKTAVAAFDIRSFLRKHGGRVLYVAHMDEILFQARETFSRILGSKFSYGNFFGKHRESDRNVVFASFQLLAGHREKLDPEEFDYIVYDESHHGHAPTFRPTVQYFRPKFMLALTATPERMDQQDITELFGEPVFELSLEEALARNLLCHVDYRLLTDDIADLGVLETPIGKMSIKMLNRRLFIPRRDEEIARIIRKRLAERTSPRTIVFCPSPEHAERMWRQLPGAATLHYKVHREERSSRIEDFRTGKLRTLLTVDMFNEGVDVPEADVIVFMRSTQSRTIFLQQLGRGLRRLEGKDDVLVLDFVGNCDRLEMIADLWSQIQLSVAKNSDDDRANVTDVIDLDFGRLQFSESARKVIDVIAAIRQNSVRPEYTRDSLLRDLLVLAESLGRSPREVDVNEAQLRGECLSSYYYKLEFGTFNKALAAAGLLPNRVRGLADDDVLEKLRLLAGHIGRVPSAADIDASPITPSSALYVRRFGGVRKALVLVGLRLENPSDEELLSDLRKFGEDLGRAPTLFEVDDAYRQGRMSRGHVYIKRFGKYSVALRKAGFAARIRGRVWTDEEMIRELCAMASQLGRAPSLSDFATFPGRHDMPNKAEYIERFGGFMNALDAAGIREKPPAITKEYLIARLISLRDEIGRTPNTWDIRAGGAADPITINKHFGSFDNALRAAGMESKKGARKNIPRAELEQHLREMKAELGRVPRQSDVAEASRRGQGPSLRPYQRVYGKFENALRAAGVI